MAAVHHLGIDASSYMTTHEVFSLGHIGPSNFMLIQCIVLKIWRFEFFCWFGLKFLFTSPKFRFLGVWTAKRDWSSSRTPKGTSLAGTALTWRFWCRSSWLTTWARDEETKKGKERNLQWQTGCSPRPPTLTKRHVVLHAGWSLGGSYKFQVSSKSVERFSRCGVEICHFLYLRPVAYITTSTTVQAMIVQRPT